MSGMFSFSQVLADFVGGNCVNSEEINKIFIENCKTFNKNRTICIPIEFTKII